MNKLSKMPIIDIKKYGGKQVAILNGRIVASGKTLPEITGQLKEKFSSKSIGQVHIFSVPKTLAVIYYA